MLYKLLLTSVLGLIICMSCSSTRQMSERKMSMSEKDGLLSIEYSDQELLGYQYGIKMPPAGVDPAYQRSGFIHPLRTPDGHRLTQIQPEDHYHHYGLWNPWTRVLIDQDTIDFWNLRDRQGTVRFAEFKEQELTADRASYTALHEHVVLKGGQERVVLHEHQTVTIHEPSDGQYQMDIDIEYECTTDSDFKILAYRYQGLGWRATEEWNDDNSHIITSEGKTRQDADNTTARWMLYQGALGQGQGGVIWLSHPDNYNYPEPIRVWPPGTHEGAVFANFAPTKTKDWTFEPGKKYQLKYRMIIFDGERKAPDAESAWKQYQLSN